MPDWLGPVATSLLGVTLGLLALYAVVRLAVKHELNSRERG